MKTATREPEIISRNGKPVAVIIPIREYEEMLERLEDRSDIVALRKVRQGQLKFRPLEP